MRIATATAFNQTIQQLQKRQENLTDAQVRLTSGLRVMKASDDPASAARAERALAQEERAVVSQRAVDASRSALLIGESALGQAVDLLQSAREVVVSAGNASYSARERETLAGQLREIREQLLSVANRADGAGTFTFGGQGAMQPPFVNTPAGVTFTGIAGTQKVGADEPLPSTVDGALVWMQVPTGNGTFAVAADVGNAGGAWIDAGRVINPSATPSVMDGASYEITFTGTGQYNIARDGTPLVTGATYEPGTAIEIDGISFAISGQAAGGDSYTISPSTRRSVFDGLDQMIQALSQPYATSAQVQQAVIYGLGHMDASLDRLQSARSAAGETLKRIDGVTDRLGAAELAAQTERSVAVDLDLVQAISAFQSQQTGYQAALQSYAQVQQMSLFQYLRG